VRLKLSIARESWPIAGTFTISRGSKTAADVVVVTLSRDGATGRGECVPYSRYGETIDIAMAALEMARAEIEAGLDRNDVPQLLKARSARNALDCALWDLEAKSSGLPAWRIAGLDEPRPLTTAFTLSLDTPERMAEAARRAAARPILKLKLGDAEHDAARLGAVRRAVPAARLIVDANEGWSVEDLPRLLDDCARGGVELVEQPLPASADAVLADVPHAVPVCADESAHDVETLDALVGRYDALNIKLDKTGGLTGALALRGAARERGLTIMVGCMVGTSLAMAPAALVAQGAEYVDLDGPLLLARDRDTPIRYEGGLMQPPPRELWG
jgi:L-alanine-DL-glutamate epimerase-like enolase superfamily enzyme